MFGRLVFAAVGGCPIVEFKDVAVGVLEICRVADEYSRRSIFDEKRLGTVFAQRLKRLAELLGCYPKRMVRARVAERPVANDPSCRQHDVIVPHLRKSMFDTRRSSSIPSTPT